MYIHERDNWTDYRWHDRAIMPLIEQVRRAQGRLYGLLAGVGFDNQLEAMAENLTRDLLTSSEIEGVRLNYDDVRSSIARRLGIKNITETAPSHYVEAVVAVMLDAIEHYDSPLTKEKLCAWQSAFFPYGTSEGSIIETGKYRSHEEHIVSGYLGRQKIHYIAPAPERVETEMQRFIAWFNQDTNISELVRSAIAHLWFVSIHPFEDGNGRLARILADILIARSDASRFRFYNITSEINKQKSHYYKLLERMQRSDGDITEWIVWYLGLILEAILNAEYNLNAVLAKRAFWQNAHGVALSERQTRMLNLFLDGYQAKITTKTWAQLSKCSTDTANRDIQDLVKKELLSADIPNAKRPSYTIRYTRLGQDELDRLSQFMRIEDGCLKGELNGTQTTCRISDLDAELYARGELSIPTLLQKYCPHLL